MKCDLNITGIIKTQLRVQANIPFYSA